MSRHTFSTELETWLKNKDKKTLDSLERVFRERSFAIIILVLMALPALPLPTGGVSHVFELIVILITLEMIVGRKTIWLPKSWRRRQLGKFIRGKFVPFLIRRIRWFESFSRPRLSVLLQHQQASRVYGLVLFIFTLFAFLSPPFSGLDTLPALGAVIVTLSLVLGDAIIFIMGIIVGSIGIGLIFALGTAGLSIFKHFI